MITALFDQADARLQVALVMLFIRRPQLAGKIPALVGTVSPAQALELQTLYMAAVYLQRLWATRLRFYLGRFPLLPDLYSAQLDLPPAEERFGKTGLHALAERWTARSTYPFNRLASLNKTMELFFEQLKLEATSHEEVSPKAHLLQDFKIFLSDLSDFSLFQRIQRFKKRAGD